MHCATSTSGSQPPRGFTRLQPWRGWSHEEVSDDSPELDEAQAWPWHLRTSSGRATLDESQGPIDEHFVAGRNANGVSRADQPTVELRRQTRLDHLAMHGDRVADPRRPLHVEIDVQERQARAFHRTDDQSNEAVSPAVGTEFIVGTLRGMLLQRLVKGGDIGALSMRRHLLALIGRALGPSLRQPLSADDTLKC